MLISVDIGLGTLGQTLVASFPIPQWQSVLGTGNQMLGSLNNGFTVDLHDSVVANNILNAVGGPNSTLSSGTIILPTNIFEHTDTMPINTGEFIFRIFSDSTVTALSVTLYGGAYETFAAGTSIPTTIAAGGSFSFYLAGSIWYRLT